MDGGDSGLSEASQDPSFQLGCTALLWGGKLPQLMLMVLVSAMGDACTHGKWNIVSPGFTWFH